MNETFACKLISPEKVLFDGQLWQLTAHDEFGSFSVRAKHQDILAKLAHGNLEIAVSPEKRTTYKIKSGILSMKKNTCLVTSDIFEPLS